MKIEGRNSVRELLKTDKTIDKILVANSMRDKESRDLVEEVKRAGVKFQYVDKAVLDKESPNGRHQGFLAYASDYEYHDLDDILKAVEGKDHCLIVILDGVEDPHNLGSVIRVCECGGADGLIIGKHRSASVTDVVMRISEGSANHVRIARETNLNRVVERLKEANIWTYALELGGRNIHEVNLKGRTAIVVGGEDTGVNKLTIKTCDETISIPMYGKINSLNASVSAGVVMYEVSRQRLAAGKKEE